MGERRNLSKINLMIDAIMLIVLMIIAGLGFLIKYVLLPGYKVNEVYGGNVELFFGGLDRHQWGAIHLYVSLFFLFLVLLHIILHWKMIICIFRNMFSGRKTRLVLALGVPLVSLFFIFGPLFIKPEVTDFERRNLRNRVFAGNVKSGFHSSDIKASASVNQGSALVDEAEQETMVSHDSHDEMQEIPHNGKGMAHHDQYDSLNINGSMTLSEVATRFNIRVEELAEVIKVPVEYAEERLGRLRKLYGFGLNELRAYVYNKIKK